jgi:hypothetical protein
MTEIIQAIDAWTLNRYGIYTEKLWGFCELVRTTAGDNKQEQVFPMTIPSNPTTRREKAVIDDRYNFITWIRWASPVSYSENADFSFGKNEARFGSLPLRIVLAHKITLGEDLVFDFINAFPSKFSVAGQQLVFTEATPSIDPDHESIFQQELGPANYQSYEKHRLTWNLYVINVTMQFLECEELTP